MCPAPNVDVDAALCVLPPADDGGFFDFAIPYSDLKEVLGDQHTDSQMVHSDTLKQRYTYENTALGLIAAAGGIPFTIENSLPGDADLIIGLDVGQSFDDNTDSDSATSEGIRVGASTTAIYHDGTILGHTNTGAQSGERIPARELMRILRQVVIGYRQRFDEKPEHIVIHRDGFMNDPLDEVEEYLREEGVSFDIIEVRKQAPTRIVSTEGYGYSTPSKGVACIDRALNRAFLLTFGAPEDLASRGTPRPITVERAKGSTDIGTLARQVYLLSQCHIGVSNTTVRVPISTSYADLAATAAANGYLPKTTSLETGIGFI
ncbi:Piwi domain-containing protein [Haloferax sp. ATB1]|uniref:Piwi domain-containing protein n=1 Tax=Haloferax sp. ATB1 TaxID=1508454 RepID=UPI000693B680|nr:Piwi domain-containing protein [Haloferax sp. ATB1]